jgi:alpha-ketoglutarate-dependent 2,4-dichlorophenoxyacetate dioxygenase
MTMSTLQFEPLHVDLGVQVTGITLSGAEDEATVAAIQDAIDEYSFVVFPDQSFDDEKQLAFTQRLGAAEPSHVAVGQVEYFGSIGNVQLDGSVLGNDHQKTRFLTGNNLWHTDASFKPVPAMLSIMCAYETPDEGGETLFVSTRSAYARLPSDMQAKVDPLIGIHDYVFSRSKVGKDAVSPALAASLPPVRQKLVRSNPANGKKNLFIGSHVREIEGLEPSESRSLLDGLVEHAAEPDHILTYKWRPNDLVIWDNRALLHRGAGYDADKYRRRMRQTRVSGIANSLEE